MGKSTQNIISEPLMLVGKDGDMGSERSTMQGERTYYRPVANEYGTLYKDVLVFQYTIVKCGSGYFSEAEQLTIETWLTSPKLSRWLEVRDTDDSSYVVHYCGKFVKTEWIEYDDGYIALTFTFETNAPYPWTPMHHEFIFEGGTVYIHRGTDPTTGDEIRDEVGDKIVFTCPSHELEEPVYPTVTIKSNTYGKNTFTVTNETDDNNSFSIELLEGLSAIIDCRNLIIKDKIT